MDNEYKPYFDVMIRRQLKLINILYKLSDYKISKIYMNSNDPFFDLEKKTLIELCLINEIITEVLSKQVDLNI